MSKSFHYFKEHIIRPRKRTFRETPNYSTSLNDSKTAVPSRVLKPASSLCSFVKSYLLLVFSFHLLLLLLFMLLLYLINLHLHFPFFICYSKRCTGVFIFLFSLLDSVSKKNGGKTNALKPNTRLNKYIYEIFKCLLKLSLIFCENKIGNFASF
jgi:hypothetical protein